MATEFPLGPSRMRQSGEYLVTYVAVRVDPCGIIVVVIAEIVLALVIVMIVLPVVLFAAAQRWATVSPRFGRWLDQSASRLSPRLSRWISDPSRNKQDTASSGDQPSDG